MNKLFIIFLLYFFNASIYAQPQVLGSEFSYQGDLQKNNAKLTGSYDFIFRLFDENIAGSQIGSDLIVTSIQVDDGIFTTLLDFGVSAFIGNKTWLEIEVKASVDASYELLTPRQQLTSSPYAIHAQFIGANAVSDVEIQDGSITTNDLTDNIITTSKLENNSVTLPKIAASSISSSKIIDATIQTADLSDNLVTTSKLANNTVTTAKIAASSINSSKIIDATIQNADLANTIITSNKIATNAVNAAKIAANAVGSSEISSNAVGTSEIIESQVQNRITGSCSIGMYISSINQDGTVVCMNAFPKPRLLGLSATSSQGGFNFNGKSGQAAAYEMCQSSYPTVPTSHMCTPNDIDLVLQYDNTPQLIKDQVHLIATWSNFHTFHGFITTSSRANNCHNLGHTSGVVGMGITATFFINNSADGSDPLSDKINYSVGHACGTSRKILCCSNL